MFKFSKLIATGGDIWLITFYLTLWVDLALVLFYFLSFFAILMGALGGGFGSPHDRYY